MEGAIKITGRERKGNTMNIVKKSILGITLMCFLMGLGEILPSMAEAALSVLLKNETGYDLEEVKYVQEVGGTKSLVGQAQNLSNGGTHTFTFKESGVYRVYASFTRSGGKVYAKGNGNNLRDGGQYSLTLKKVVFAEGGTGLNFINRSEFEAIR